MPSWLVESSLGLVRKVGLHFCRPVRSAALKANGRTKSGSVKTTSAKAALQVGFRRKRGSLIRAQENAWPASFEAVWPSGSSRQQQQAAAGSRQQQAAAAGSSSSSSQPACRSRRSRQKNASLLHEKAPLGTEMVAQSFLSRLRILRRKCQTPLRMAVFSPPIETIAYSPIQHLGGSTVYL